MIFVHLIYLKTPNYEKYNLLIGTQITKIYKGNTYIVKILGDNKFKYNDEIYKTLSAVAKEISGKKFSGNDFFGLKNKNK